MKRIFVVVWLMLICSAIGAIFWYNEWRYHLPTPIPPNYKTVITGTAIQLNEHLFAQQGKPIFLHFFNPDCPCSKFNIPTFKSLVREYGRQVNFFVVVMNNERYTAKEIQKKFDLNIPVLFNASLATACGVYSTPQVALLDAQHKLYYRGNYNRSRYCTDEKTSYAKIAIAGLLHDHTRLIFDRMALTAYGCSLPNCSK